MQEQASDRLNTGLGQESVPVARDNSSDGKPKNNAELLAAIEQEASNPGKPSDGDLHLDKPSGHGAKLLIEYT